jgi:hypothetical protein
MYLLREWEWSERKKEKKREKNNSNEKEAALPRTRKGEDCALERGEGLGGSGRIPKSGAKGRGRRRVTKEWRWERSQRTREWGADIMWQRR